MTTDARSIGVRAAEAYAAAVLAPAAARQAVAEAVDAAQGDDELLLGAVRYAAARHVPAPVPVDQPRGFLGRGPSTATCALVPELLAARAAGRLSTSDIQRLSSHLVSCARCREQEASVLAGERAFHAVLAKERAGQWDAADRAPAQAEPVLAIHADSEHLEPMLADAPEDFVVEPPANTATLPEAIAEEPDAWRAAALAVAPAAGTELLTPEYANAWSVAGEPSDRLADSAPDDEDWMAAATPERGTAPALPRPSRPSRTRVTHIALPAAILVAAAGGAMAAAGVFETGPPASRPSASKVTAATVRPTASATATPLKTNSARATARRRQAERLRRLAAQRARELAAARSAPAAAQPAPRAVPVRTVKPAPTPTAPERTAQKPAATQTTPTDATKPAAPSSEPGRQPPGAN